MATHLNTWRSQLLLLFDYCAWLDWIWSSRQEDISSWIGTLYTKLIAITIIINRDNVQVEYMTWFKGVDDHQSTCVVKFSHPTPTNNIIIDRHWAQIIIDQFYFVGYGINLDFFPPLICLLSSNQVSYKSSFFLYYWFILLYTNGRKTIDPTLKAWNAKLALDSLIVITCRLLFILYLE